MKTKTEWLITTTLAVALLTGNPLRAASQAEVNASVTAGLAWLATQQQGNGAWLHSGSFSYSSLGTTALAVTTFTHHAKQTGQDPFADAYLYSTQVKNGLNYIFVNASRDVGNHYVSWGNNNIYGIGPALMAVTASGQKNRAVDLPASVLHGMTYLEVAQEIVNYIGWAQVKAGPGIGMWYYSAPNDTGDMSIAGWVALGLGYASHNFDLTVDPQIIDRMSQGIDQAQWTLNAADIRYGSAGYTGGTWSAWSRDWNWNNLYKAGHLLYMMELCGDAPNAPRVLRTQDYIVRCWNFPNSGYNGWGSTVNGQQDMGWKGGPWAGPGSPDPSPLPSWIASTAMMKAFLVWGMESIGGINWYEEMTDRIVGLQRPNGSWEQGGYPTYHTEWSTIWAMLTMLRAVPSSGSITDITLTSAVFHAESPEAGMGYFVLLPRGADAPTPEEISAGTGHMGEDPVLAGSGAMLADTEHLFPLAGLSINTRYDLYFTTETGPETFTSALRVQFSTLSPGSMINVTSAMDIRCTNWRLDRNTGAMLADFRFAFDAEQQGKPELHTAFWVAIPLSPTWRLLHVDGNTPDGLPYTDVTASVEAALRKAYDREVMLPGDAVTITVGVYSLDRSIPPIEELLAFWADPPPVPGDLDHDGRIDDMEMLTAVDEWKAGRLGDFQLIGVLENWRQATP